MARADVGAYVDADGFFDRRALVALAKSRRAAFVGALPFAHAVFDDLLPEEHVAALARAFPPPEFPGWKRRDHAEQAGRLGQLQRTNFEGVDPRLRHFLGEMNGMAMVDFLEALSGIEGLVGDPHFRGAGLQCTLPGGHLGLHSDFDRDRFRHLGRRLTVMFYLPTRWEEAWGGELELHPDGAGEVVRIAPRANRLVVMLHGDRFWHGHPTPLGCPVMERRQAIAAYYYTAAEHVDAPKGRGALWRG